jgi:outer membrane usher protein
VLLEVDINQQSLHETAVFLKRKDGMLFMGEEDLQRWRLRKPDSAAYRHEGKNYYPLAAIPGATFQLDEVKQTLTISTRAETFTTTVAPIAAPGAYPPPISQQPGGFFNYNLSIAHSRDSTIRSGLFEAGFFSRYGAFTNTFLAPALGSRVDLVRLESTYAIDYSEKLASLRLGDSVNRPGAWGLPVRFGGIQYGTNFGTQPGFVRSPLATTASGQATLPSVVDVFVNNALVSRQSVPPGPFTIPNIPIVSGSGDVRVVVRDLLGREQILTQPFYGSTALLKEGLEDYSYEVGTIREDFGISSNRYGKGLAAATYRRGLSNSLTGELHGEYTDGATAVGLSSSLLVERVGLISGTLAGSHSDTGTGRLVGYGMERQARVWSYSVQSQIASSEFRQIGLAPDQPPRRRQTSANVGFQFGSLGSVSLTYVLQEFRDRPDAEVASVGYIVPLGKLAQLGITALKVFGESGGNTVFVTLAIPLDGSTSATVGAERSNDRLTGESSSNSFTLQKSLPLGEGYGYRLQTRDRDALGSVSWQNNVGTYQADAARISGGGTATRLSAAGGIGTVGGYAFFSRVITESFGVVRVADYPDVHVLQDNQVVASTNDKGYAVLPRLRPYDKNPVSINQNDLPFDAIIGSSRLVAVPYFRSGVMLDFPVRRVRGATLRIVLGDGSDLPSGALARIEGQDEEFPVALRGEAYLNGFGRVNRLVVTWKGQSCAIDVPYPDTTDPLPNLGTFICKGVKP